MLGRGSRPWPKIAASAIGACLLMGVGLCGRPDGAVAQEGNTATTAPAPGAPDVDYHRAGAAGLDKHPPPPTGAATANKSAFHDHAAEAGQRIDRNHAEEQQQALHAEIQKKFKEFDKALKKTTLAAPGEPRRRPQPTDTAAAAHDQTRSPTANSANPKLEGKAQTLARHRPPPTTIPAPVREASANAPANPHGSRPMPTTLGGLAHYDPKSSAVLSGTTIQHRL